MLTFSVSVKRARGLNKKGKNGEFTIMQYDLDKLSMTTHTTSFLVPDTMDHLHLSANAE